MLEIPFGEAALAVPTKTRLALLHAKVPQELSGHGYGLRLRMAFSKSRDAMEKG
jgi:hypothetical protein